MTSCGDECTCIPLAKPKEGPIELDIKGDTYVCVCGQSKRYPLCDGSHNAYNAQHGTKLGPWKTSPADGDSTIFVCGCGHSKGRKEGKPLCDGTHESLKDPDFDLIMDSSLAKNEYPSKKMAAIKASKRQSLMAQNMNEELFNKLKGIKTASAGWTIARAINTGVMYSDSFVGIHAGDLESYQDFASVFNPVIEGYHQGFKVATSKHVTDLSVSKISEQLSPIAQKRIVSTRIRVARNLAKFPLNPGGSLQSRLDIADLMERVFAKLPGDLAGTFYRHTTMKPQEEKQLIDDHFLFRGKDKMQAASGYHEFWPKGRGIFVSKNKQFLLWINEGDHLRIISMQEGGDVKQVFERLSRGIAAIEKGLTEELKTDKVFMTHPVFGCVTCCPSNLGTGMRGSVHIMVPRLIKKHGLEGIDKMCRERMCQARGSSGEHSAVVDRIDISNWRRLGFPEWMLVEDMIKTANHLAKLEQDLEDEEARGGAGKSEVNDEKRFVVNNNNNAGHASGSTSASQAHSKPQSGGKCPVDHSGGGGSCCGGGDRGLIKFGLAVAGLVLGVLLVKKFLSNSPSSASK